ncbi:MAG: hypothetical protein KDC73_08545 [Ignavibacteriae bacterium]|nr:hypothetical protein [Ignavibacteriota bacterium]MCB0724743.1 hypothetical protein [Ignavibacteriota bacterium]MCB9242244.1 hypothetical protein [Ignavibacteriales bacterium]
MRVTVVVIAILGLFYLTSCSNTPDLEQQYFDKGVYAFTIYDTGGDSIASGTFNIQNITGKDISGTYIFDNVYQPSQIISKGETKEMKGSLSDDRKQVFINANPRMADANIFLRMTAGLLTYSGEWSYSTFVGVVSKGSIKATKRE